MATINVPGLVKKERKNGAPVFYWQAWKAAEAQGFNSRPLRHADGTPMDEGEAIAAARAIVAELNAVREGAPRPVQNEGGARSFTALIRLYRASKQFRELADATRKMYEFELDIIEAEFGDIDVRVFGMAAAKRFLNTIAKPSRKRATGAVLRTLLSFAADSEGANWIKLNPLLANGKKNALGLPGANVRVEVASFAAEAAIVRAAYAKNNPAMALAVIAAATMGQREHDVLHFDDKWFTPAGPFAIHQHKRKKFNVVATLPFLPPRVVTALERVRAARRAEKVARLDTRWILNPSNGWREYKLRTFQQQFAQIRDLARDGSNKLGLPPCAEVGTVQFRDFRDTFVTRGIEAECSELQMCSVSGHKPKNLPYSWRHYVKLTPELARQCLTKMMAYEAKLDVAQLFKEG